MSTPTITAKQVKELRDRTGAGMMDCKNALSEAGGDFDKAVDVLRKNQDNLDNSLRLMAPFYRVFANTLGTGPWFDTWIANFPPVPQVG